ncbi:ricin-type beta-trefoil lectin domain protein [Streptomyces sp. NPDC048584]|uniref:ricin-type beta-trefoil lectin domain protein n=1 Tax=Streptomyces sp. NPDC048584 TaxID=3365573 RepID=UPI00371954FE
MVTSARHRALARIVLLLTAVAVLASLVVRPEPMGTPVGAQSSDRPDDWYETTADEQLRFDQCLMNDALRLGGPGMYGFAQNALDQTPEKLRELADLDGASDGPLREAYEKDKDDWAATWDRLYSRRDAWERPLDGLEVPAGFTVTGFQWVPGVHEGDDFYDQTGLGKWAGGPDWNAEFSFYDPTPAADEKVVKAVTDLGAPLYGEESSDPDPRYYETRAFEELTDGFDPMSADDARLFLASGGFPRTAPEPGTPEYRIAVEDLKTRFASCAWQDPIDPNQVLRGMEDVAAQEWQQEIGAQAVQRNQILDANREATTALTKGSEAMADMLGQSWIADHLVRWQDYWSAGGVGWIGDSTVTVEVPGAKGSCLDVAGGGKTNGTPVQIYTCNGGAAQQWTLEGSEDDLHLRNVGSQKCLDVAGNASANGTKIQISDCYKSKGQSWQGDARATAPLKSVTTGKCLDLSAFTKSTDARLWDCKNASSQKFLIKPSGHKGTDSLSYPDTAQFTKAKKGVTDAQTQAKKQLAAVKAQFEVAKKAGTSSDTATQAAYAVADAKGAPRGRGLLSGQQKAQVTKGAVAALEALVKAAETAEAATRASAGDGETIAQRALAQAAQSKAEFRREAAHTAELQAKAAADAAKVHRDNAKKDKETAEAKLAEALKAEGEAKTAAADAHAKRLAAEAEEKTAEAEKKTAAAKQAEAAEHRRTAESEATKAKNSRDKAEAAEGTASDKRDAAVKAKDKARDLRDDAWDAEQKADAARAKADAKEAYAQAHEADSNAQESRAAADAAAGHADDAEAAATRARSAADAATTAAAEADAAATRAEAAAKRARAASDGAQAAKLKADAAVKTATSAAADAIQASKHAAAEAKTAVELADEAEAQAKTAKSHANEASKEAGKAVVASAKAAGFAHVTAQAAVDAGNSAQQVAAPANDAIQLGSPYVTTDSAASLVVLTGQASKSIAEQQKAVADAHAKNAQSEASAAQNLADQAQGDAKQAYVHAANAAGYASDARGYAKEALGYSADAALAASKAVASLARTVEYDRQATEDAEAADKAAGRAEGHAKAARDSADEAALDAAAARSAATEAEEAAKEARAAATRADAAATEAEEAAKDALKYAEEAQEAAEAAERNQANQQVSSGAGTGIGGTFYVVDEDTFEITDAQQKNDCVIEIGFEGCTVTFAVTFSVTVDYYLCVNPDVPATSSGCPSEDTLFLERKPFTGLKKDVTQHFSKLDLIQQTVVYRILKAVLVQDFVDCWHGSVSGCAWAASNFIPGKAFEKIAEGIRALDAAMKTGIGVADAFRALRTLDLDPATLAKIEAGVNAYEDVITACRVNSFPGDTLVLMADGTRRMIRDVREGDQVLAAAPGGGKPRAETVTDTFRHDTERLVTIALAGGSSLDTTAGHKIRTSGRGWVLASELRPGDRLVSPDGTLRAVTGVHDRPGLAPRRVYDLTVDRLHTFYVRTEGAGAADVMVHNCLNLGDEDLAALRHYEIHTLKEHVRPDAAEAFRLAARKGQPNTVWKSQEIAQQAVDRVVGDYFSKRTASGQKVFDHDKWKKFQDWAAKAREGEQYRTITGTWDAYPSLGKRYHPDGRTIEDAGNEVVVILMKVKGHTGQGRYGFVVKTAYPK